MQQITASTVFLWLLQKRKNRRIIKKKLKANNTQRGCVMSFSILDINMPLVLYLVKYFFPEIRLNFVYSSFND